MPIVDANSAGKPAKSPQLPLLIPSGRVHAYFVQPEMTDRKGVKRTVLYYEQGGQKSKFMAKDEALRADLQKLGTMDLPSIDEEFSWTKGSPVPTIRVIKL